MAGDISQAPGAGIPAPAQSHSAAPVENAAVESAAADSAPTPTHAPTPPADREGMGWFAVHVAVGFESQVSDDLKERFAREGLMGKFGEILVPTEKIESLAKPRKGREPVTERKLYPGYLFIQMRMDPETWHLVKNTRRVTGFIGGAREEPAALPEDDIREIRERIEAGRKPTARGLFETGDMVRVKEGPFSDFTGTVESVMSDRRRLTVSVMVFGRSTPVELSFEQVEKV